MGGGDKLFGISPAALLEAAHERIISFISSRAGLQAVKITPEKPVRLAGYAARVKPSESVDQDIFATALALKDAQDHRAVLVTLDLCTMPANVGRAMRDRIMEKTKLDSAHVVLS